MSVFKALSKILVDFCLQIQRRYNAVRVNSMKEARDAKKMLAGTLQDVKKVDRPSSQRVKMEV